MLGGEWWRDPVPGEVDRAGVEVPADFTAPFDDSALDAPVVVPAPTAGAVVVLAPGQPAVSRSTVPRHHGHFIVVTDEELVFVNGIRQYRCARPGHFRTGGPPLLARVVSVFVHRRAVGPLHKGHRFIYAIGRDDRLLGTVDASDTWPFRQDHLRGMCELAGVGHEVEVFDTVSQLVAARPEWAAPDLEFEVNHPRQELTREWADFITSVFIGIALLGGGISAFYLTPVGLAVRVLIALTAVVLAALTLWGHSRRRMRRSLRRRDSRAVPSSHPAEGPEDP